AARRPAPPPPTSTTSWLGVTFVAPNSAGGERTSGRSGRVFGDQLVHQERAIVSHYPAAQASVVILVTDAAAAAGVVHVTDDETFVVAILATFPVHDLSAWRRLVLHRGAGRSHVLPFHRAGVLSSNNRVRQAGLPCWTVARWLTEPYWDVRRV